MCVCGGGGRLVCILTFGDNWQLLLSIFCCKLNIVLTAARTKKDSSFWFKTIIIFYKEARLTREPLDIASFDDNFYYVATLLWLNLALIAPCSN